MKTATKSSYILRYSFLISFFFLLFSFSLTAQCPTSVAAFSYSPSSSSTIPQSVFFTDLSTVPDTWAWNFGDGNTSTAQNPIHSYTSFGLYTVRLIVVDTIFGCFDTAFAQVSICNLIASIPSPSNVSCNGGSDGSATATPTNGTAPYTYAWSNGPTTASNTGLVAGTYTVTITDNTGCFSTASTTIFQPTSLVANPLFLYNVDCNGNSTGTITSTVAGGTVPYTFTWSNSATTATIFGVSAATYTVTITDNNGCTATTSGTITEPTVLSASIASQTNVDCNGNATGSATAAGLGGTAPYTYTWSNGATPAINSSLAAATYTVTITDNNGCTATTSATITEPTALSASIASQTNVDCNGNATGSATAAGSGGTAPYTYTWSNGATPAINSSLAAATYTVTITDNNGCTATTLATITEPTAITTVFTVSSNLCFGDANGTIINTTSGGTSPYTYNWSDGPTTTNRNNLAAGTYTLTVTDNNGCTNVETTTVIQPAALQNISSSVNVSCNGGSDGVAAVSISGGTSPYSYLWSNSGSTATITGLSAGTYTITVTDAFACTLVDNVIVSQPTVLTASISSTTNVSCNGGANGTATVSGSGGTAPYTFLWNNASPTATTVNLTAGSYFVTITDNNACTAVTSTTITEPTALIVSTVVDSNATGFGVPDGGATASANGGSAPYTFVWSNSATTASITGVLAGTYTVTVTDANACTSVANASITEPSSLSFSISFNEPLCNGGTTGSANVSQISGGVPPYTYNWSNASAQPVIVNVAAGTYSLTVSDNNGNTASNTVSISEPFILTNSITIVNATCLASLDGGLTNITAGGTAPYAYAWSNSATTASLNSISAGTYTVTITDANGCALIDSAVVSSSDNISPTALAKDTTLFLDINGQLNVAGSDINAGSNDNCTIDSLIVLNGQFSCADIGANTVQLIAVDSDGNRDTTSAVVTVVDSIAPTIVTQTYSVFLGANGTASYTASDINNGTLDACGLDSIWSDTSIVFNCSNAGANTVWLYASDINGNIDSATATVMVMDSLPKPSIVSTENGCGSYTWAQNGQTYTAAGTYNDTLQNSIGCDSVYYVLNLTIDTAVSMVDTIAACDSYSWRDGIVYTSNNSAATFALQNSNGCDSIVYTLNLTINSSDSSIVFQDSACTSYTWAQNNQTYTSSGIYTDVFTNAQGCDSIISLDLEIRDLNLNVVNVGDSLFAFARGNSYQWYNCGTNSIIPGATRSGYKPDTSGSFAVIINNGLCFDTSACEQVVIIGLNERGDSKSEMSIYPNPSSADFYFEVNRLNENEILYVFDMRGKLILEREINQYKTKIETVGWNGGIYFIRFNDQMRKVVITR